MNFTTVSITISATYNMTDFKNDIFIELPSLSFKRWCLILRQLLYNSKNKYNRNLLLMFN